VAPGIFPDQFCFDPTSRSELRALWDLGDEPVILSTAMFRPGVKTEGLKWVMRACARLLERRHRFYLVIAGDGKERNQLHEFAQGRLPGRVRFVGEVHRDSLYRFYSAADVFVFPGIRESLGMVFLEAQSCALPVVAFRNGGIPEVVRDGATGLLVTPYSLKDLTEAIEKLILSRELRSQMGQAGRHYVRSQHDLDKNYQKIESVIKDLIRDSDFSSLPPGRA
jgi:glycosyltransferase involved in cell wall biosynthesis